MELVFINNKKYNLKILNNLYLQINIDINI